MKITKKMILILANDDWNDGIIDFELFVNMGIFLNKLHSIRGLYA